MTTSKISWFHGGAAAAVQACKASSAVLVVVMEPSAAILAGVPPGDEEPPLSMYSRGATRALHRITFSSSLVAQELSKAHAICLRLRDGDRECHDFMAVFPVPSKRPCVFMIGPDGSLLVQKLGFVGVAAFVGSLRYAKSCCARPEAASAAAALLATSATTVATSASVQKNSATAASSAGTRAPSTAPPVPGVPKGTDEVHARPLAAPGAPVGTGDTRALSSGSGDAHPAEAVGCHKPAEPAGMAPRSSPRPSSDKSLKLSSGSLVARLCCRLADGRMVRKSFPGTSRFQTVREWVAEEAGLRPSAFLLGTSFPRRIYDSGNDGKQLLELRDLCPSATLVVTLTGDADQNQASTAGLGFSSATAAASTLGASVSAVASFVRGSLPAWGFSGGGVQDAEVGSDGQRNASRRSTSRASMAEMRQEESSERGGSVSYDNGNSTQFGSGDASREFDSMEEKDDGSKN